MRISGNALVLPALATVAIRLGTAWAADSPQALFPEMGPTLSANPSPMNFDLGPWLGNVYVTGAVSGLGVWQSSPMLGNNDGYADIGNGTVFVQNASGPVQIVAQVGIYSIPSLSEPYTRARELNRLLWGPVPQAYVKLAPSDRFSVQVGRMPSLIGWESDFTFQNANIQGGLLWEQQTSVNQGVRANYTIGPIDVSLSLNDGFFSGRLHWLTGAATYEIDDNNWLTFSAGGSFRSSGVDTFRTPIAQNNSAIYNLVYDTAWGSWALAASLQYTHVPDNSALRSAGFTQDASTLGVAVHGAYAFNENWKLGARGEYIRSSGSFDDGAPELVTGGPGASNWSITLTPSYQYRIFFARAEFSYLGLDGTTPGFAFGKAGTDTSQVRVLFETGIIF